MKELTSLAIRIDIEEAAIRHCVEKHLILTEQQIQSLVVAALDAMDIKAEIDKAIRSAVNGQVHSAVHAKAMEIARREAQRVVAELYPEDDMRRGR